MDSAVLAALVGGFAGLVSSYWGPIGVEKWRQKKAAEDYDLPRQRMLKKLLENENYKARKLATLCMHTGTTPEECRRLLIGVKARGCFLDGDQEGWGLISKMPFDEDEA